MSPKAVRGAAFPEGPGEDQGALTWCDAWSCLWVQDSERVR